MYAGCGNQLLVGYTRGLVLVWDRSTTSVTGTFISSQQLECATWRAEQRLVSAHNDGSFVIWDSETGEQVETRVPGSLLFEKLCTHAP